MQVPLLSVGSVVPSTLLGQNGPISSETPRGCRLGRGRGTFASMHHRPSLSLATLCPRGVYIMSVHLPPTGRWTRSTIEAGIISGRPIIHGHLLKFSWLSPRQRRAVIHHLRTRSGCTGCGLSHCPSSPSRTQVDNPKTLFSVSLTESQSRCHVFSNVCSFFVRHNLHTINGVTPFVLFFGSAENCGRTIVAQVLINISSDSHDEVTLTQNVLIFFCRWLIHIISWNVYCLNFHSQFILVNTPKTNISIKFRNTLLYVLLSKQQLINTEIVFYGLMKYLKC